MEKRGHLDGAEVQAFLNAGDCEERILEVLAGVAMKTLSNYAKHLAKTPLDRQFEAWESAAVYSNFH